MSGEGMGAVVAVAAGLLLSHRALRRRFDAASSGLALAATLLGTFALDLVLRPGLAAAALSFALGAGACALRTAPLPAMARGAASGLLAGAAALLHLPGLALAALAWPRPGESGRGVGMAAAAALLTMVAGGLAVGGLPALRAPDAGALLGSRQGLLYLTPVLWVGLAGLLAGWRRAGSAEAPLAVAAGLFLALHTGSGAAGAPPLREEAAALLPLLTPGLAYAAAALRGAVRRRPGAPLAAAAALLVCWNLVFMQQYATGMVPRDFPVRFGLVARNAGALIARATGTPLAWPANWVFAARHGVEAARYDAAEGKRLDMDGAGGARIDVGRLDLDEALLLEGWSVRHPCGGAVCRAVEGEARLLLPAGAAGGHLTVRASGQGWLRASVGGAGGAAVPLAAAAADLPFAVPPGRGTRVLTLAVSPGGRALIDGLRVAEAAP